MKIPFAHSTKPQETLELKAIIASLLDQAREKVSFVDRDDPDDIFALDIRMLHEAVSRLQKTQAEPVIISTTRDREYIDYICPTAATPSPSTARARRKGCTGPSTMIPAVSG